MNENNWKLRFSRVSRFILASLLTSTVLLTAATVRAQSLTTTPTEPPAPGQQGSVQALSIAVRALLGTDKPADPAKAEARQLLTETQSLPTGESRRRLAKALVLLRGQEWDAKQEFAWSLTLRPDRLIADSTHPGMAWLSQLYPANFSPASGLKLKLSLAAEAAGAKAIKEMGSFEIFPRDMVERPYPVSADMSGIADGTYRIVGELLDGETSICTFDRPINLVAGIDSKLADVERRLAKIAGHDGTRASIRYPYDLARVYNIGRRNFNAFDLGLGTDGKPNHCDFATGMKRSDELLAGLEGGNDLLYRAKGDNKRHYWFAEAGEIMPYHVYVPSTWDGKTPLPTILILHGNTRDQDFYFDRDDHVIPKTAEKHGYMLVGVFGYHPNGGYNSGMLGRLGAAQATAGGPANAANTGAPPDGRGPAGRGLVARGGGEQFANDMPRSRVGELSEADTMHVFEMIRKEYPVDPKRTYLFGYSAGGAGTYYMGPKYADNWAAIATGGGTVSLNNYPFDRLKGIPVHIFYGDQDSAGVRNTSQSMDKAMKERGMEVDLVEYKGFNHDTAPGAAIGHLFDFFDAHHK